MWEALIVRRWELVRWGELFCTTVSVWADACTIGKWLTWFYREDLSAHGSSEALMDRLELLAK